MKKLMVLVLAAVLLLSLTGCDLSRLEEMLGSMTQPANMEDLSNVPDDLFQITDSLRISLHFENGDDFGPYTVYDMPENLLLGSFETLDSADVNSLDHWLIYEAGDGSARLTVYDAYRDILCYEHGEEILYYRDSDGMTLEHLRKDFDELELASYGVLHVFDEGDHLIPLREFASHAYPEMRLNLSRGNRFRFEDYDLIDYQILEESATVIIGRISYYVKPSEGHEYLLPGIAEPGTGIYESWFYCTETVAMELREDGFWYQVELEQVEIELSDPTVPSATDATGSETTGPIDPTL